MRPYVALQAGRSGSGEEAVYDYMWPYRSVAAPHGMRSHSTICSLPGQSERHWG